MSEYTKGPWRTGDLFGTVFGPPVVDALPKTIATVVKSSFPTKEQEANARLIAAAPELLEALRDLQREIRVTIKMDVRRNYSLMVADAAANKIIAKAEGRL